MGVAGFDEERKGRIFESDDLFRGGSTFERTFRGLSDCIIVLTGSSSRVFVDFESRQVSNTQGSERGLGCEKEYVLL